jgi:hypothetical protein
MRIITPRKFQEFRRGRLIVPWAETHVGAVTPFCRHRKSADPGRRRRVKRIVAFRVVLVHPDLQRRNRRVIAGRVSRYGRTIGNGFANLTKYFICALNFLLRNVAD